MVGKIPFTHRVLSGEFVLYEVKTKTKQTKKKKNKQKKNKHKQKNNFSCNQDIMCSV